MYQHMAEPLAEGVDSYSACHVLKRWCPDADFLTTEHSSFYRSIVLRALVANARFVLLLQFRTSLSGALAEVRTPRW